MPTMTRSSYEMWNRSCQPSLNLADAKYVAQKSYGYVHAVTSTPSARAASSVASDCCIVYVPPVLMMCSTWTWAPVSSRDAQHLGQRFGVRSGRDVVGVAGVERGGHVVRRRHLGQRLDLVERHTRRVFGFEVDGDVPRLQVLVAQRHELVDLGGARRIVHPEARASNASRDH